MSKKKAPTDPAKKMPRRANGTPRNHRELGQAILAECDPVIVGCGLLEGQSESVKARALETVANWAFGPPVTAAPAGSGGNVRIVCTLPRPAREAPAWSKAEEAEKS